MDFVGTNEMEWLFDKETEEDTKTVMSHSITLPIKVHVSFRWAIYYSFRKNIPKNFALCYPIDRYV